MRLRDYVKEDSAIIAGWIKDEKMLYDWSADCIGKFPLSANDLDDYYVSYGKKTKIVPLSMVDEEGRLCGHFFIRFPKEEDKSIVRFCFVIINPALAGQGKGKEMIRLAVDYAKDVLNATKITLGVFVKNDSAKYCYQAVGFQTTGEVITYKTKLGELECFEMERLIES